MVYLLEDILENEKKVFLDNNLISFEINGLKKVNSFEKFRKWHNRTKANEYFSEMEKFFDSGKIIIIQEIKDEFNNLKNVFLEVEKRCNKYSSKKSDMNFIIKDALNKYCSKLIFFEEKMKEKINLFKKEIKNSDFPKKYNSILESIKTLSNRKKIKKDSDYEKKSITDECLVSSAMAYAIETKKNIGVISNDIDIKSLVSQSYKMIASKFMSKFKISLYKKTRQSVFEKIYDSSKADFASITAPSKYYFEENA